MVYLGKYYLDADNDNRMFYVASYNNGIYTVHDTNSFYIPGASPDTQLNWTDENIKVLISSARITEISPPTIFFVTNRDTYKIKDQLKAAGARWDQQEQKWFFTKKPNSNLCRVREVLIFPFTGKKIK